RDTVFAAVSRGPVGQMRAFKARMGWTFPWYSSRRSDFNYDFHVSFDEARAPIEYNNRAPQAAAPFGARRTAQAPAAPINAAPPADAATSHRPVGGRSRHDRMLAATSSPSDKAPAATHALADPGAPAGRCSAASAPSPKARSRAPSARPKTRTARSSAGAPTHGRARTARGGGRPRRPGRRGQAERYPPGRYGRGTAPQQRRDGHRCRGRFLSRTPVQARPDTDGHRMILARLPSPLLPPLGG